MPFNKHRPSFFLVAQIIVCTCILIIFSNGLCQANNDKSQRKIEGHTLRYWASQLESKEKSKKSAAIAVLTKHADKSMIPVLAKYIAADFLSCDIVDIYLKIGDKSAVKYLIPHLCDKNYEPDPTIFNAILRFGKEATPFLLESLHESDVMIRLAIIQILSKLRDRSSILDLSICVFDEERVIQSKAITALMKFNEPESAVVFAMLFKQTENTRISAKAAKALYTLGNKSSIPFLVSVFKNKKNPWLKRLQALETLEILELKSVVQLLPLAINSDQWIIRFSAAHILLKLQEKTDVKMLAKLINDKNSEVRTVISKGFFGKSSSIMMGMLFDKLIDSRPLIRAAAKQLLNILTGQDFGADANKWRAWWEKNKDRILSEEAEKERLEKENAEKESEKEKAEKQTNSKDTK